MYLLKFENQMPYEGMDTVIVALSESKERLESLKKDLFQEIIMFRKEIGILSDNISNSFPNKPYFERTEEEKNEMQELFELGKEELNQKFPLVSEYKNVWAAFDDSPSCRNEFFIEEYKVI